MNTPSLSLDQLARELGIHQRATRAAGQPFTLLGRRSKGRGRVSRSPNPLRLRTDGMTSSSGVVQRCHTMQSSRRLSAIRSAQERRLRLLGVWFVSYNETSNIVGPGKADHDHHERAPNTERCAGGRD